MGIQRSTLKEWKKKHKEFSAALKENKNYVDSLVEDSLFRRAMGYEYEEITTEEIEIKVKKDNIKIPAIKTRRTTKQVVPDVTAQIFWLKNRQKEFWRDKIDHEHTGKDGGPIECELTGFKEKLMKKLKCHEPDGSGPSTTPES